MKPELENADQGRKLLSSLRDAALLTPAVYRGVSSTGGNTGLAFLVVGVTALGFGLATLLGLVLAGSPATGLFVGLVLEPLVSVVAWFGGTAVAWAVGSRMATPDVRTREFWPVVRALAFAQTPNLVGVLVVLPTPYRGGVWLAARLWLLLASSTAIRESLGLSKGRLLVTLTFSAAAYTLLLVGIIRLLAPVGMGNATSGSFGLGF